MSKRKPLRSIIFFTAAYATVGAVFATEPADKDVTTDKHYHFPFVHVDVTQHKDGTKDYDVKAPFTKVHNPAGADNATVKAPFYKSDQGQPNTANSTKAPTAVANKPAAKKQQN